MRDYPIARKGRKERKRKKKTQSAIPITIVHGYSRIAVVGQHTRVRGTPYELSHLVHSDVHTDYDTG